MMRKKPVLKEMRMIMTFSFNGEQVIVWSLI